MEDHLQSYMEYTAKALVWDKWPAEYMFVVPKKGDVFSYADLEGYQGEVTPEQKKILYIEVECCSGSDYSNSSSVVVSNHRAFLKLFKHVDGVHEFTGGYGTFGVVVRADVAESNKEIIEKLEDLENYPVVDEDNLYELEQEWQNKALKDPWFYQSFGRDIQLTDEYITGIEKLLTNNRWLKKQILHVIDAQDGQIQWDYSDGYASLRESDIIPYLEDELLLKRCKKSVLPLLVDRKWSEKEFAEMYEKRLRGERV